jgi:hypothetical protein
MLRPVKRALLCALLVACGGGDGETDAGPHDAGQAEADAPAAPDDAAQAPDAMTVPDAVQPVADASPPDAPAAVEPTHVHIHISNTCVTSVDPPSVSASLHSDLHLIFHNHSVDYAADVWSSRNYGYVGLPTGATWDDPIRHCNNPVGYTEWFDVSIEGGGSACPGVRFEIHCGL